MDISNSCRKFAAAVRHLGPRDTVRYYLFRLFRFPRIQGVTVTVRAKDVPFPLHCRLGTSDFDVFFQIFVERSYDLDGGDPEPAFVLDLGAYVGYSSIFFLTRFPGCRVLAVEPDRENYEIFVRNLAPFGERVKRVNAAVWSRPVPLKFDREPYRDCRHWARRLRPCKAAEAPDVTACDIPGLLREAGVSRVSILKMDIEGAEAALFSEGFEEWIGRFDTLMMEVHDDTSEGELTGRITDILKERSLKLFRRGELLIAERLDGSQPRATT